MSKDIKGWVAMKLGDIPDGSKFTTLDRYSPIFTRLRKTRKGVMVQSTVAGKTEKVSWVQMENFFYVTQPIN